MLRGIQAGLRVPVESHCNDPQGEEERVYVHPARGRDASTPGPCRARTLWYHAGSPLQLERTSPFCRWLFDVVSSTC